MGRKVIYWAVRGSLTVELAKDVPENKKGVR
jgi:hypothetical protein